MKSLISLILLLGISQVIAATEASVYKRHETVYKIGDESGWSAKDYNDAAWSHKRPLLNDGRILWYRINIEILKAPESLRQYGIQLEAYGEYEIFWDGVLIGKNGNPGQEETLPRAGELWANFSIPSQLTEEGNHVIALRASLLHFPDHTYIHELKINYYDDLLTDGLIQNTYMHIFAGTFLITSLYFLFLFISNKKAYSTLIFSICCFLVFALVVTVFSKEYLPLHYSYHVIRLQIISTFLLGITFLIPFYFSMQFPYPKRKLSLIIYPVFLIFFFLFKHHAFDFKAGCMVLSMWVFSCAIVLHGVNKHIRGSRLVLLTLVLSMATYFATSFVISLYAGLGFILLGMLYLLALNIKTQRLAYETSLVQSTRLRLELLKKNIQPHFLMNTLTSLIDWVEESPKKGVLFIEALAKEFDLFNQIEDQKLIPIEQEIELCQSHIEIMAYRKEIKYDWKVEGMDYDQKIPPAIIHTLLENGITHSMPLDDNTIKFKLDFESKSSFKCYTFLTFAKSMNSFSNQKEDGTGLKYVKARLTESYQSNWELTSEPTNEGWKNTIKIHG
ncbi:MAG: histidine kinase [Reichenbachiella sp.]